MRRHLGKFIRFGIVGGSGVVVNNIFLFFFINLSLPVWLASAIATEISIISNFFGNHYFTFKDTANKSSLGHKFLKFQAISLIALAVTVAILTALVIRFGQEPWYMLLLWNMIAIGCSFLINFILNLKYTWAENST